MKLKPLLIGVAVLAALAGLVIVVNRPAASSGDEDARVGQFLCDRAVAATAAKVRLSDSGRTVTLARGADSIWRVAEFEDFPADFSKLSTLVGALTEAKVVRFVTDNPDRMARLGLKDTALELYGADGSSLWSVALGRVAEEGGGRYARPAGGTKAYLVDFSAWLDLDAKAWADRQLLDLGEAQVARIEIPFAAGRPIILSRARAGDAWAADRTPAGRKVGAARVSDLLAAVGKLRYTEAVDRKDPGVAAARAHERVLRLTTFSGKTYTVALGRPPAVAGKPPGTAKGVPAGPVYARITCDQASAPINGMMGKRAFQVAEAAYTVLPKDEAELFEPAAPASASVPGPSSAPAR